MGNDVLKPITYERGALIHIMALYAQAEEASSNKGQQQGPLSLYEKRAEEFLDKYENS